MNSSSKNKLLTWLVVLLLVANAATIAMFWLRKAKHLPQQKGTPKEFLIKELKFDAKQQQEFDALVKEHQQVAEKLRSKTKEAKEDLFNLLKQANVTDSAKQNAAKQVSVITEELDLLTLDHFQKIRIICTAEQQKKFDEIINEVIKMMAQPRPPMGPGNRQGPPPGEHGDRPPGE